MMSVVLLPMLIIGAIGLLFGIGLAYASKKFEVEVDPRIEQIAAVLPGANCGGCGMPGCGGYADAIVTEGAPINKCAPGGPDCATKIAEIMGLSVGSMEKKVALIHCSSGGTATMRKRYLYTGTVTCKAAVGIADGPNLCRWGCVGMNDCFVACKFDAITVDENNQRHIDPDKCTACGACVQVCPRSLIELVPASKDVHIVCSSKDKGPEAKQSCGAEKPCIGCGICAKNCPVQAITVENNLARIDYEKCISCGLCAEKCPTKAIIDPLAGKRAKAKIIEEGCIGCTICAKACPVNAITGELKQVHTIDATKCVGCGICVAKCPKKTIQLG